MTMVPRWLGPGDTLRQAMEAWLSHQASQGVVISGIVELSVAQIHLAGQARLKSFSGDLELLQLAGSLCRDGAHLQLAIAINQGVMT